MICRLLVLLLAALAAPLLAQDRDFLTAEEVGMIRLAQEPNERLQLYTTFAKARLDQLEQLLSQDKPGRSKFAHDLLDDYTRIIEAIDTVSDDALKRKLTIDTGMQAVADAEKVFAAQLERIRASQPKDIGRYEFALEQAIDATTDSLELAQQDLAERAREILTKDADEKKQREAIMRPEEVKAKREAEAKEAEQAKKRPTLRRKEEIEAAKQPPAAKPKPSLKK